MQKSLVSWLRIQKQIMPIWCYGGLTIYLELQFIGKFSNGFWCNIFSNFHVNFILLCKTCLWFIEVGVAKIKHELLPVLVLLHLCTFAILLILPLSAYPATFSFSYHFQLILPLLVISTYFLLISTCIYLFILVFTYSCLFILLIPTCFYILISTFEIS